MRSVPALLLSFVPVIAQADVGDERARLDRGEVIVSIEPPTREGEGTLARMKGVVDAPPAKAWELIDQCGLYSKHFPRIARSEELYREGGRVRCRVTLEAPWPLDNLVSVTMAEHTSSPRFYRRAWKLESGDYLQNEGSWTLTPFDEKGTRTLAQYEVRTRLKSEPPRFLSSVVQKRALPDTLEALRRFVRGE